MAAYFAKQVLFMCKNSHSTEPFPEKPQNYYELLNLPSRNFTPAELKKAYREASRIYHPDKNLEVDTTDLFIEVKKASEILGSSFIRTSYDLFFQTKFD